MQVIVLAALRWKQVRVVAENKLRFGGVLQHRGHTAVPVPAPLCSCVLPSLHTHTLATPSPSLAFPSLAFPEVNPRVPGIKMPLDVSSEGELQPLFPAWVSIPPLSLPAGPSQLPGQFPFGSCMDPGLSWGRRVWEGTSKDHGVQLLTPTIPPCA